MTRPLKILVADDSPTQAAFLKMALKKKGHEVITVKDGIEVVEMTYRENPDLIVSDIIMPRLNGYQVCRLLRDDPSMSDLPIILVTSLEAKVDMFWGLKSGADLYLTKVNDMSLLVEDIEAFISKRELKPRAKGISLEGAPDAKKASEEIIGRVIRLLDKSLFESTILNDMGGLVDNLEDYRKIMFSVLAILSKVIEFDLGLVTLINEEQREYFVFVNGPVSQRFIAEARAISDRFITTEAGFTKLPDVSSEEINDKAGYLNKENQGDALIRSQYLKMLSTKTVPSGAIGLFSQMDQAFSERFVHTFAIIFQQINIVIDYSRLYEKNKQLSITDGLTKVYNHRFFQEALKRDFARSSRQKLPLSLIILDIDHFKSFNDTYGHQQGDIILHELARLLVRSLRGLDIISRYGGEEFTILMPDASLPDAIKVAERLRRSIEAYEFPGTEKPLKVTVSMGVASVPHHLICNPAQLINAADQALYQAKKNGRNRVEEALQT